MISLNLNKPGMLDRTKFDSCQIRCIESESFEEMYENATPTLQPGVRYHHFLGLWLELSGTVKLSTIDTYPEDQGRLLRQGENKFYTPCS